MRIAPIIHVAAYGAACGAAYAALINPILGVGCGAVVGVLSFVPHTLFTHAIDQALGTVSFFSSENTLTTRTNRLELLFLGFLHRDHFPAFLQGIPQLGVRIGAGVLGTYGGLHVSQHALLALGLKVAFVPSVLLALKVASVVFAIGVLNDLWHVVQATEDHFGE